MPKQPPKKRKSPTRAFVLDAASNAVIDAHRAANPLAASESALVRDLIRVAGEALGYKVANEG